MDMDIDSELAPGSSQSLKTPSPSTTSSSMPPPPAPMVKLPSSSGHPNPAASVSASAASSSPSSTPLGTVERPTLSAATAPPSILLLSLDKQPYFDDMYSHFLATIRAHAAIIEASSPDTALEYISLARNLVAIICTDAAISQPPLPSPLSIKSTTPMSTLQTTLVNYVKSGGTMIMGCMFSSFAKPEEFRGYMGREWGLGWRFGDYTREVYGLNPAVNERVRDTRWFQTVKGYSMKAVSLKGVQEQGRVYLHDGGESPVVLAPVGRGWLGWVGDVNAEEGTSELMVGMVGQLELRKYSLHGLNVYCVSYWIDPISAKFKDHALKGWDYSKRPSISSTVVTAFQNYQDVRLLNVIYQSEQSTRESMSYGGRTRKPLQPTWVIKDKGIANPAYEI
ncbi:hypothetical protein B7494_g4057 [Chlorociboria aeruginascens]|nr:hypothetical protein B7494_g4057 [Chlorociboria aeruginascens]